MRTLEVCNICPEFTCVEWMGGRSVISRIVDYSHRSTFSIDDCLIRRAVIMEDLENDDKTGLKPTILLGL